MSFNDNGRATIVDVVYDDFAYLAYGIGEVADNDTSLASEYDRVACDEATAYNYYFECIYNIPAADADGELITEYGLALADTGNISTTYLSYPLEKNTSYEILILARVVFRNKS
jgi:hypothetical protein